MSVRVAVLCTFTVMILAPALAAPLDGPDKPFHDDLLDNLPGHWLLKGKVAGREGEMDLRAEWVLNHQFLHIRERAIGAEAGAAPYDAEIYVGYDNASDRYVVHWIDIFGGRFSETLGYGSRDGASIRFTFEYPDGPFHNVFTWNREAKTWRFFLEQKDEAGAWTTFADQVATKLK